MMSAEKAVRNISTFFLCVLPRKTSYACMQILDCVVMSLKVEVEQQQQRLTCEVVSGCSSWPWSWRAAWSSSSRRRCWRSTWAVWRAERGTPASLQGRTARKKRGRRRKKDSLLIELNIDGVSSSFINTGHLSYSDSLGGFFFRFSGSD